MIIAATREIGSPSMARDSRAGISRQVAPACTLPRVRQDTIASRALRKVAAMRRSPPRTLTQR